MPTGLEIVHFTQIYACRLIQPFTPLSSPLCVFTRASTSSSSWAKRSLLVLLEVLDQGFRTEGNPRVDFGRVPRTSRYHGVLLDLEDDCRLFIGEA